MEGTKSGTGYTVQLKPIEVPAFMQDGEKFIKWDEESGVGTPVTLRVDKHGFFLFWTDQNKETDLLDLATVRDTRTGRFAKIPKESKLKQIVTMGSQDTLEEKTVSVVYGPDFVNVSFVNFCCTKKEIAKLWTDELLKIAFNLLQFNSSMLMFLKKAYTKLTLMTDKTGKIPVKNVVKMFAQNKEDRRRVEKALDLAGLASGKNEALNPAKFQLEDFFNFYKSLTQRGEVETVFEQLCGNQKKKLMTASQFVEFLNKNQRDPRLNEILYPYANTTRAKDLIEQYEPNKYNKQKGQLSFDGFLHYILSEDNMIVSVNTFELREDMDQPLAHYFINSSHNTYLTGHQLTGKGSPEMYRQCLLAGCRCVELDFWNGRAEEPVIVHGYTFVPEISAKEVIEAIAESAFKTSEYPVVLSFENHCNPRQQAKIAQYCREYFGEMLLDSPLDAYPLEPGAPLPPPSALKRRIIIKNKKKHHHKKSTTHERRSSDTEHPPEVHGNGDIPQSPVAEEEEDPGGGTSGPEEEEEEEEDEDESTTEEEEEDHEAKIAGAEKDLKDKAAAAAARESEAGAEISALVNYVQPVHFNSFEVCETKNRAYEMSSFDEKQSTALLKEYPIEFVNYNKQQLSRVYPTGSRFDSSNFMPQMFWNAGCQLVALNYQTLDLAMQLNLGIFEYNNRCGYLLKPEFMRRRDRRFDPFAESTVDGIIAGTVSVQVISGQFLTDKRVGTYVDVEMFGLPTDTVRKKFRTRTVPNNGINPVYDEEAFVFKKVVLPELACIRIAAYEESGKMLGHRVLPVLGLCPGYRQVGLRNEGGQPAGLSTLFLHVVVKDYVPDGLSDFAEALANPIKYQSKQEKRAHQLSVLTEGLEESIEEMEETKGGLQPQKSLPNDDSTANSGLSEVRQSVDLTAEENAADVFTRPDNQAAVGSRESITSPTTLQKNATRQTSRNQTDNGEAVVERTSLQGLEAESLDKLMEHKLVKEKRTELEKRLEQLRKKHDKEKDRLRLTGGKSSKPEKSLSESDRPRSKFFVPHLVKRLSSRNMVTKDCLQTAEVAEAAADGEERSLTTPSQPVGYSEKVLALHRDQSLAEKELQERYQDQVFTALEKVLRESQNKQLKRLRVMQDHEEAEVMRRIQVMRREEVKARAKIHKDKDEMERIKREVDVTVVEKGVVEREKLSQIYEKKKEALEQQHREVWKQFEEEKSKVWSSVLGKEYTKIDHQLHDNMPQ